MRPNPAQISIICLRSTKSPVQLGMWAAVRIQQAPQVYHRLGGNEPRTVWAIDTGRGAHRDKLEFVEVKLQTVLRPSLANSAEIIVQCWASSTDEQRIVGVKPVCMSSSMARNPDLVSRARASCITIVINMTNRKGDRGHPCDIPDL